MVTDASKSKRDAISAATLVLSASSLVVSLFALATSREATAISRRAYERSTGRVRPDFSIRCDARHVSLRRDGSTDPIRLPITITNHGQEAIRQVRFEISTNAMWAGDRTSDHATRPTRLPIEFNGVLQPGESRVVDVLPGVVEHLKTLRFPDREKRYWLMCEISCSAQIVGEEHFASAPEVGTPGRSATTAHCAFGVTREGSDRANPPPWNFGVPPDLKAPAGPRP